MDRILGEVESALRLWTGELSPKLSSEWRKLRS